MEKLETEQLLLVEAKDPMEMARRQGRVQGLREALSMPEIFFPPSGGRGR